MRGQFLDISAKISGNGLIKNALIEANPFIQIFEASISLSGCRAREFSAMWYGASPENPDNSEALQQSINACINSMPLFIPGGVYKYSQSLKISRLSNNRYVGASIHLYGEGGIWNGGRFYIIQERILPSVASF